MESRPETRDQRPETSEASPQTKGQKDQGTKGLSKNLTCAQQLWAFKDSRDQRPAAASESTPNHSNIPGSAVSGLWSLVPGPCPRPPGLSRHLAGLPPPQEPGQP